MKKVIAAAALLALAIAVPAAVAALPYKLGRYSGKIAVDPASGSGGTLAFTVNKRTITRLTAHEPEMLCVATGGVENIANYTLHVPKSWKVKLGRKGTFSFSGTLPGEGRPSLKLKGKVSGRRASGKIMFDFRRSGGVTCTMSGLIAFTARH